MARKQLWAVFDERGTIWTSTIKNNARASKSAWLRQYRDHDAIPASHRWRYWQRAGYRCDRIKITRIQT
jgi:hypothetical protein